MLSIRKFTNGGNFTLQEKSNHSKTKFILIAVCIVLFSVTMLVCSFVQIAKINKLNEKIADQERQIEELNKQLEGM